MELNYRYPEFLEAAILPTKKLEGCSFAFGFFFFFFLIWNRDLVAVAMLLLAAVRLLVAARQPRNPQQSLVHFQHSLDLRV